MNVRVYGGNQVTLPRDVVEALELAPGSEVAFELGPQGEVRLTKAADARVVDRDTYRQRVERAVARAREHLNPLPRT